MSRPRFPYRYEVQTRLSIRQIAAQYTPREYRQLRRVVVEAYGVAATVRFITEPSQAYGGQRRWLVCPRCARRTQVIGLVVRLDTGEPAWSCGRKECGGWRGRVMPKGARLEIGHRQPLEQRSVLDPADQDVSRSSTRRRPPPNGTPEILVTD